MPTDWDLLDRYAMHGDQCAFSELVTRHLNLVYGAARRMLGAQDAEDIAQAVFLLLSQRARDIPRRGALAGWLFRTTRYCCSNVRIERRRRWKRERLAAQTRPEATAAGESMNHELEKLLDDALAQLGERERQAILVYYLENKTAAETGAALGISTKAAEKRLERGVASLRRYFARNGVVSNATAVAALMSAESAKAAPPGLALQVAAVTSNAGTAAIGISKGATAMMRLFTFKATAAAAGVLLVLAFGSLAILKRTARAEGAPASPAPAKAPATLAGNPRTADSARQLFLDTVHGIETAKNLTFEVTRDYRSFATDPVTDPKDQASVNSVETATQKLSVARPGKLRLVHAVTRADGRDWITDVLFDEPRITIASLRGAGTPVRGHYGEMKDKSTDDILRGYDTFLRARAPELAFLADSEANASFFHFSTDWKWLGAATDEGIKVWRVQMTDAQTWTRTWEAWITQDQPHRFTRLILIGASSYGIGTIEKLDHVYKTQERVELRFTKWDITSVPGPENFQPPKGELTEETFAESTFKLKVGDALAVPLMSDVDGKPVDLAKPGAPVILDFWFGACGPCMKCTPKLDALAGEFAKEGVLLYGVNGEDSPDKIKATAEKEGWTHVTNLLDAEQRCQKYFGVTQFPSVVVIGADGKLLFRASMDEPAAMGRLHEVLERASAPK